MEEAAASITFYWSSFNQRHPLLRAAFLCSIIIRTELRATWWWYQLLVLELKLFSSTHCARLLAQLTLPFPTDARGLAELCYRQLHQPAIQHWVEVKVKSNLFITMAGQGFSSMGYHLPRVQDHNLMCNKYMLPGKLTWKDGVRSVVVVHALWNL